MSGQPVFQLEKNQYRKEAIGEWQECCYYELVPAKPLIYIPNGDTELLWDEEQGSFFELRNTELAEEVCQLQKAGQFLTLPLEGRRLLGVHISARYRCEYNLEKFVECLQQFTFYKSFTERAAYCNHEISKVLRLSSESPLLVYALEQMNTAKGKLVVENIAMEYGYTARQLQRLFCAAYGCTPKRMCQYIRLLAAMEIMKTAPEQSFAEISEQLGYSDPSHFQREFKRFVGMTPGGFVKEYFS